MGKSHKAERILVIPDAHVPYQDATAWATALKVVSEVKPSRIVIIGDFGDCYAVSAHPKTLDRRVSFAWEVEEVNAALDALQAAAGGGVPIDYCGGNHEWRMDRYLASRAPELGDLAGLRIPKLYNLGPRGIRWVPYQRTIKHGNCTFTHDLGRCGVNAARQSLIDFGGNLVFGHTHRLGIAYQGESRGRSHFCLNVGWLGDVEGIDYLHQARAKRDWQLGLGIIDQDRNGCSWAQALPIVNGRCTVDRTVMAA